MGFVAYLLRLWLMISMMWCECSVGGATIASLEEAVRLGSATRSSAAPQLQGEHLGESKSNPGQRTADVSIVKAGKETGADVLEDLH